MRLRRGARNLVLLENVLRNGLGIRPSATSSRRPNSTSHTTKPGFTPPRLSDLIIGEGQERAERSQAKVPTMESAGPLHTIQVNKSTAYAAAVWVNLRS